ncbi:MAG TPA: serine/threonine-protein kinase [Ktedonobacteraceae bacterium]|nr:serine/threonine-protein kinase [Ktedonobacteraceae bacterium]
MPERVGQQLGNYQLVRLLGEGGFAEVYLGEHIHLGTEAAIKVLTARLSSEEIEQFRNEARTIARLKHPHIIRVLDFGVDNGTPFLVMDYVANGTLRQRFPKGAQLPPETILPYVTQIASALQYAHDQKLIHRDIKPENMLLDGENVLLSDFGIAVVAHSSRSMNTQDQVGTLPYMAPEQLQGKPRVASDQYALGIVIYEWLTGTRPFNGMSWEIVSQHFSTPPPLLREKVPTLTKEVEQAVLKALEKEYEKRFVSVQEFAQALVVASEQRDQAAYAPTVVVKPPVVSVPPTIKATPSQVYAPLPQKTKEQWFDEGDTYYDEGQYMNAIAAYSHVLELDPQDTNAYNNRGLAYHQLKEYRQAITDYNRALELDPTDSTIYNNRGFTYSYLKAYKLAIADYDQALRSDPKNAYAYNNRGTAYSDLKEYERAIEDYDQALEIDPKYTDAYTSRGTAYFELGEYQRALTNYNNAIALNPNYANAYGGRGLAYYYLQDYRRAVRDFDRALQLNQSITWFKSERDDAYRKLHR